MKQLLALLLLAGSNFACEPGQHDWASDADAATGDGGAVCGAQVCITGQKRCSWKGAVEHCADRDGDGCPEWGGASVCPSGSRCNAGQCASTSTSEGEGEGTGEGEEEGSEGEGEGEGSAEGEEDVYPSAIERMLLFRTNLARMDPAILPTPLDDPAQSHPNWTPPPGGERACPPLVYNEALGRAARYHARDMANHSYFAHASQDGTDPFARMARFGYAAPLMGENIGMGQLSAEEVVRGWMMSPGDRANILFCAYSGDRTDFVELGAGWSQPAGQLGGSMHWVLNFGGGTGQTFTPYLPAGVGFRKNDQQGYFGVSFSDPIGAPPSTIQLVRGEQCHLLALESGEPSMGTYSSIVSPVVNGLDTPFYFQSVAATGAVDYYPAAGSLVLTTSNAARDSTPIRRAPACARALDPGLAAVE